LFFGVPYASKSLFLMLSSFEGSTYHAYLSKYSLVPPISVITRLVPEIPPSRATSPGVSQSLGSAKTFAALYADFKSSESWGIGGKKIIFSLAFFLHNV
jgi:hypothetical protein